MPQLQQGPDNTLLASPDNDNCPLTVTASSERARPGWAGDRQQQLNYRENHHRTFPSRLAVFPRIPQVSACLCASPLRDKRIILRLHSRGKDAAPSFLSLPAGRPSKDAGSGPSCLAFCDGVPGLKHLAGDPCRPAGATSISAGRR